MKKDNYITSQPARRQWAQLLAITLVHAVADIYVGIIAPVLVPMHDHYGGTLGQLIFIVTLLAFSANIFQVAIGNLKPTWTKPGLISLGTLLAGSSVLIPNLAPGHHLYGMVALALIAGFGVALVHPEGLRAVHGLHHIPTSLATAVFMVAGFVGFSSGALLSAAITEHWGLGALRYLYLLAPLSLLPLYLTGVHLPLEREARVQQVVEKMPVLPFPLIFAIGTILTISTQLQATLLPSYLHKEAGFSLSFGGLSFTLFGVGGIAGALLWGALAPRLGHLRILRGAMVLGVPMTLGYLLWARHAPQAVALLCLTGFVVYIGYPLCVALARSADSQLRATQRMGLMSGGTWAIAAITLWCLAPLIERCGFLPFLHLSWICYLPALLLLLLGSGRTQEQALRARNSSTAR